jgi:hypothetical protein
MLVHHLYPFLHLYFCIDMLTSIVFYFATFPWGVCVMFNVTLRSDPQSQEHALAGCAFSARVFTPFNPEPGCRLTFLFFAYPFQSSMQTGSKKYHVPTCMFDDLLSTSYFFSPCPHHRGWHHRTYHEHINEKSIWCDPLILSG